MDLRGWLRSRWPGLVVGVFVVPLTANLLVGLPYRIYLDRDIELHGLPVTGRAVSERQVQYKGGVWHRVVEVEYTVDGERYADEYGLEDLKIGDAVALRYAPVSPGVSRLDRPPSSPWDEGLALRLLTSWSLGLLFGGVWLGLMVRS